MIPSSRLWNLLIFKTKLTGWIGHVIGRHQKGSSDKGIQFHFFLLFGSKKKLIKLNKSTMTIQILVGKCNMTENMALRLFRSHARIYNYTERAV